MHSHTLYILLILLSCWGLISIVLFHDRIILIPRVTKEMDDEVNLPNTTTLTINPETLQKAAVEVVNNSRPPSEELKLHNDTTDQDKNYYSRILVQKDGRYVFSNVFVHMDIVYFVTDEQNVTISSVLCSASDMIIVDTCKIQIVSLHEFAKVHSMDIRPEHIVENAVILHGINPYNTYHIIWETIIPVISMLLDDGGMPREPTEALRFLQHQNWSIIFTDLNSLTIPLNLDWCKELIPQLQIIHRGPVYRVRKLIAGTRGRCAHSGHCSNATFVPEDSPWVFRNLIAQTHNLTKTARKKPGETSSCRITLVQRAGSRNIINFDEWTKAILENDLLGPREVRTVDFGDLSIPEQISLASSTDVFILIHGGALAHISWLPHGAIIVDINPFQHTRNGRWLVNWMRYSLKDLRLGHLRIQVNNSEGQFVDGHPLPSDCVCYDDDSCGESIFSGSTGISLNVSSTSKQVVEVVNSWRRQEYEEPYSPLEAANVFQRWEEFRRYEFQKEEEDRQAKGLPKRPSCI